MSQSDKEIIELQQLNELARVANNILGLTMRSICKKALDDGIHSNIILEALITGTMQAAFMFTYTGIVEMTPEVEVMVEELIEGATKRGRAYAEKHAESVKQMGAMMDGLGERRH